MGNMGMLLFKFCLFNQTFQEMVKVSKTIWSFPHLLKLRLNFKNHQMKWNKLIANIALAHFPHLTRYLLNLLIGPGFYLLIFSVIITDNITLLSDPGKSRSDFSQKDNLSWKLNLWPWSSGNVLYLNYYKNYFFRVNWFASKLTLTLICLIRFHWQRQTSTLPDGVPRHCKFHDVHFNFPLTPLKPWIDKYCNSCKFLTSPSTWFIAILGYLGFFVSVCFVLFHGFWCRPA